MATAIRNAAKDSIGAVMSAKSLELRHTIHLIRELDAEIFESPDKLLAYAGPSPSTYQSGQPYRSAV